MGVKGKFIERQVLPRSIYGVDFGSEMKVIVSYKSLRCVWRGGYTAWACLGSQEYYKGKIIFLDLGKKDHRVDLPKTDIEVEGNFSNKVLHQHVKEIGFVLGLPELDISNLHSRKTFLVENE